MKYLACLVGAVLALGSVFTSCKLDEPEPTPAEELYLRAFIKKYGLIDPNQDWNQARRSSVTVTVSKAKTVDVFVEVEGNYYRVAKYLDVAGTVEIPIDVPECVTTLYILADNDFRMVEIGGTADFTTKSRGMKKAPAQAVWIDNWSTVTTTRQDGGSDPYIGNPGTARSTISLPAADYIDLTKTAHLGGNAGNANITDIGGSSAHNNKYEVSRIKQGMNLHFQLHNPKASAYEITFNTAANVNNNGANQSIYENGSDRGNIINITIVDSNNTIWVDQDVKYDICGTTKLMNDSFTAEDPNSVKHSVMVPLLPPGEFQMIVTLTRARGNNVGGQLGLFQIQDIPLENLAWLFVAEDLGATDDFDFNDVIIRVQSLTTNVANLNVETEYWQVIQDDQTHLVLGAPSREPSRADETYTNLTIQAMCAGGILDSYLHFVTKGGKDFILGPNTEIEDLTTATVPDYKTVKPTEWHSWFTKNGNTPLGAPNNRMMINTGQNNGWVGGECRITVEGDFSVTNYSDIQYKDYDQETDTFDGTDFWNNDNKYTAWTYGPAESYIIHGFYITVVDWAKDVADRILGAPKPGAAPQMFCIPDCSAIGLWHWPYERVPITSVYPGFANWVTNSTNTDWYSPYPKSGVTTHEGIPSTNVYPREENCQHMN